MLHQIIDGVGVGAGQVITLDLGLDSCRVGPPDGKWGQISHGHNCGTGSPTPVLTVLTLLWCPGDVQGLLFGVL